MSNLFIEYDEFMSNAFSMAAAKDHHGLFDALQDLHPKDPKVPFVLDLINHVTGLNFSLATEDYIE